MKLISSGVFVRETQYVISTKRTMCYAVTACYDILEQVGKTLLLPQKLAINAWTLGRAADVRIKGHARRTEVETPSLSHLYNHNRISHARYTWNTNKDLNCKYIVDNSGNI